jgi:uncharacterized protein YlxW (UPF0749 family)
MPAVNVVNLRKSNLGVKTEKVLALGKQLYLIYVLCTWAFQEKMPFFKKVVKNVQKVKNVEKSQKRRKKSKTQKDKNVEKSQKRRKRQKRRKKSKTSKKVKNVQKSQKRRKQNWPFVALQVDR